MHLDVTAAGPDDAADVYRVVHAAFAARPRLDPPADATGETADTVRAKLAAAADPSGRLPGGLLCRVDGEPAGALLLDPDGAVDGAETGVWLRRVAVVPGQHRHGIASALVAYAEDLVAAAGYGAVRVVARAELPETVRFWRRRGFLDASADGTRLVLVRPLPVLATAATADATRALAARLAGVLRAGDVLVLTGDLGAGKTTFVQGLAAGLGVGGRVTSPTFVIARTHRPTAAGPGLVHVDAYRLGGVAELDDLDLETPLEQAVLAVEWGEGLAEGLADDRLEIALTRPEGDDEGETRTVRLTPVGSRWRDTDLAAAVAAVADATGTAGVADADGADAAGNRLAGHPA